MGQKEITSNQLFLFFPQCFLPFHRQFHQIQLHYICCQHMVHTTLWKKHIYLFFLVIWQNINPLQNKPWFLQVFITNLLKTLWEKEKLLIKSNFSFSHSVFYPYEELSATLSKVKTVTCKPSQLGRA